SILSSSSTVVSAWDANGPVKSDPVLGAIVAGDGMMADLDPEHRRVTDLFGFELAIALAPPPTALKGEGELAFLKRRLNPRAPSPGLLLRGKLRTTQLRDYREPPESEQNLPVYLVSTIWQSVLDHLTWAPTAGKSQVLSELSKASRNALSLRL